MTIVSLFSPSGATIAWWISPSPTLPREGHGGHDLPRRHDAERHRVPGLAVEEARGPRPRRWREASGVGPAGRGLGGGKRRRLLALFGQRHRAGRAASSLPPGPESRWSRSPLGRTPIEMFVMRRDRLARLLDAAIQRGQGDAPVARRAVRRRPAYRDRPDRRPPGGAPLPERPDGILRQQHVGHLPLRSRAISPHHVAPPARWRNAPRNPRRGKRRHQELLARLGGRGGRRRRGLDHLPQRRHQEEHASCRGPLF